MSRQIFFCKSWVRAKKRPIELWSELEARVSHENGRPYVALLDSNERPFCFLEVTSKAIGVSFLDELLRESLSYDFQEVEPGLLFLTKATYRDFDGESDTVVSGSTYIFTRDGQVKIQKEYFNPHRTEAASSLVNVNANYSTMPAFGDYDDLVRVERSLVSTH